jgi:hypothetical protein
MPFTRRSGVRCAQTRSAPHWHRATALPLAFTPLDLVSLAAGLRRGCDAVGRRLLGKTPVLPATLRMPPGMR